MFLRHQLSPYCITVPVRRPLHDGGSYLDEIVVPAMHLSAPTPHGRHGDYDAWGPDEYGYTDFDDYHLAIYGA